MYRLLPFTRSLADCYCSYLTSHPAALQNCFFYSLVYDPQQKTLLADKGEIRVGGKYQADMSVATLRPAGEPDPRRSEELETLVWTPTHNLPDRQIDQFMVIARSVHTAAELDKWAVGWNVTLIVGNIKLHTRVFVVMVGKIIPVQFYSDLRSDVECGQIHKFTWKNTPNGISNHILKPEIKTLVITFLSPHALITMVNEICTNS